jgi:two-component system, chemotaxis family, sensor kinase Cph1
VAAESTPYRSRQSDNVRVQGDRVFLKPQAALPLSLVLHELATNAAKYGALCVREGRIDVSWWREDPMLIIRWVESGGPPVQPPSHRGFGLQLIERSLAYELEGASRMEFHAAGLRCELRIPLANVTALPVARAGPHADIAPKAS